MSIATQLGQNGRIFFFWGGDVFARSWRSFFRQSLFSTVIDARLSSLL